MTAASIAGGRYRIDCRLGGGGMAIVQLARDLELERPVAVKVLTQPAVADAAVRSRFVREARLAARLSHPNVVHVYDAGEDESGPYIVMEYVPGETLAELLARRGKLSAREASAFARQAAFGLQHAHENGLVHRDVKPANLLVREDGILKVADFGIARAAEGSQLTKTGTLLGTAAYLAPEQAVGGEVTPATDLYSLGAVLYETLTGRTPYEFRSLTELAVQQSRGAITPVRDLEPAVPPGLEELVMRCLAADPRFRPPSAAEVAATLAASEGELPPRTQVPVRPAPPRKHPSSARRRLWLALAAAALLGAIAIAVVLTGRSGNGKPAPRVLPPKVSGVPRAVTPAGDARNLARWLREHAG